MCLQSMKGALFTGLNTLNKFIIQGGTKLAGVVWPESRDDDDRRRLQDRFGKQRYRLWSLVRVGQP